MVKVRTFSIISVFITCLLVACSAPEDNEGSAAVTSNSNTDPRPQFSQLSDGGVRQIRGSRTARFNLRDLTITNEEAGVPLDSQREVIIGNPGDPDIQLTLVGPNSEELVAVQTMWFTHHLAKSRFSEIIFWRHFDNPDLAHAELREGVQRWGFHPDKVDSWIETARTTGGEKEKSSLGSGIGPSGLIVDINASRENAVEVLQYTVDLDPRDYNTANIDAIRTTGRSTRTVELGD